MSVKEHRTPVQRVRVVVGALCLVGLLATIVVIGEILRHPQVATEVPEDAIPGGDPRDEIVCAEPLPREGQARDTAEPDGAPSAVNSNDLFDCPQAYDGRVVRYRGEVVGALLHRDIGVWAQLNDDVYAELLGQSPAHRELRGGNAGVGVLLPAALAAQVELIGGPHTHGDVLEITGTFNRVDPTGEVAVIRADGGRLMSRGEPTPQPPLHDRRIVAWVAIVVAGAMVIAERVAARRR